MNLKVKKTHVLVNQLEMYSEDSFFYSGVIVSGPDADLGVKVFFKDYLRFDDNAVLVSIEDVFVWVAPEVIVPVEVISDDQNNPA